MDTPKPNPAKEAMECAAYLKASNTGEMHDIDITIMDVITLSSMYDTTYHDDINNPFVDVRENSTLHKVAVALSKSVPLLSILIKQDVFDWDKLRIRVDPSLTRFVVGVPDSLFRYARKFIIDKLYGDTAKEMLMISHGTLSEYEFKQLCAFMRFTEKQTLTLTELYLKNPEFCGAFITAIFHRSMASDIHNAVQRARREKGHLPDAKFKAADKAGRSQEEVDAIREITRGHNLAAIEAASSPDPKQSSNREIANDIKVYINENMSYAAEKAEVLCESVRRLLEKYENLGVNVKDLPILAQCQFLDAAIAGVVLWTFTSSAEGELYHFNSIVKAATLSDEVQIAELRDSLTEKMRKMVKLEEEVDARIQAAMSKLETLNNSDGTADLTETVGSGTSRRVHVAHGRIVRSDDDDATRTGSKPPQAVLDLFSIVGKQKTVVTDDSHDDNAPVSAAAQE